MIPVSLTSTVRFILNNTVYEKETKMRESLKIMSLEEGAYALSYLLAQMVFITFSDIIFVITFLVTNVFTLAYIVPVFFNIFFFGASLIMFCLALSTVFSDSRLAVQVGNVIVLIPMLVYVSILQTGHYWVNYIFIWVPQFPFMIIMYDALYSGFTPMNVYVAWVFAVADVFILYALYLYLSNVIPDTYGISKHPCFCFRRGR